MNEWMAAHHTANISVNNNYNIKATTWWIHLVWWLVYFLRCIFSHFPLFRPSCVIHSPLFSPISVPVVSHLCIILSIFHSLGGRGSSNEWFSVFLVLSARLFSSSHAPFGCWSLAGNSILPPPSPVAILLSSPHRPTQNGGNSAKQTEKRATKKKHQKINKKFRKWNKKFTKLVTDVFPFLIFVRLWSLNCFLSFCMSLSSSLLLSQL